MRIISERKYDEEQAKIKQMEQTIDDLRDEMETDDMLIIKLNNQLKKIIETAQENNYNNEKQKLAKIIELAKFEETTSPINE